MRASQDNCSQCLEGSTQGQGAETLQAIKRGRINECPNLDLVINKEEPGIHQQDDSGVGRTCLRLCLGKLRTAAGRAIVTVKERAASATPTGAKDKNSSVWLLEATGTSENPFSSSFDKMKPRLHSATQLH